MEAYLAKNQKTIKKTHDLELLVELCSDIDSDFEKIMDNAIELTPFSTMFRYPGPQMNPDEQEVVNAIKNSEEIYQFVIDHLDKK